MMLLNLDLVLVAMLGLVALAVFVRVFRPDPGFVGTTAGVGTLAIGLATLALNPASHGRSFLILDGVSLPRVTVLGLMLTTVFLVMPMRHRTTEITSSLLALAAVHLAMVMSPPGPLAGGLWVLGAAMTWLVLPPGPARRLALPYLALSAGTGLVGEILGGDPGSALLLVAVAVRMGVFPFHSWVVGAYSLAPTTVAVALVAPMSALGLIGRMPLNLDEGWGLTAALVFAGGSLLMAAMAVIQRELCRAIGFLTVSIQGSVLLGVLDGDHIGHLGGLMMWGITGLSLLGLGLVTAALLSRRGHIRVDDYSGLLEQAPFLASLFLMFGLAAVGAPGTADFASADLVLHGGMAHQPLLLMLFIGAVSTQGYTVLHLFYRVFFGPEAIAHFPDALPRERVALVSLAALLILSGLAPQLMVDGWLLAGDVAVVSQGASW